LWGIELIKINKKLFSFIFIFLIILGVSYENIIERPFPFVAMSYIKNSRIFNSPPNELQTNFMISTKIDFDDNYRESLKKLVSEFKTKKRVILMMILKQQR